MLMRPLIYFKNSGIKGIIINQGKKNIGLELEDDFSLP